MITRMYPALLGQVDGVRLLSPEQVAAVTKVAFTGADESTAWFGWGGVGGSYAGADAATGTVLAVDKTRLSTDFTTTAEIGTLVTCRPCG